MSLLFKRVLYLPIFFLVAVLGYTNYDDFYTGVESLTIPLTISMFLLLFITIEKFISVKKNGDILEPDFLFIILFSVFHFSYIILYYVGISEFNKEVFYNNDMVPKAIYFCIFVVICFQLGYGKPIDIPINRICAEPRYLVEKVFVFSKFFVFLCLLFFWIPILSLGLSAFSNYKLIISVGAVSEFGKFYWVGQYLGITAISLFFLSGSLLHRKLLNDIFTYLTIFYIISFLLLGDRGGFVTAGIIPAISYNLFYRKISIKLFIIIFVCLLIISTVVSLSRTESVVNPVSMYQNYSNKTEMSPVVQALNEFGSSLKTVTIAMDLVPKKYEHWWGRSYIYALSLIFPNVVGLPRVSSGSPGAWLTETAFGAIGDTYGRGGSIAMESYLNFGFVLGALSFVLFGFVLKRIYLRFTKVNSLISGALYFSVISSMVMWVRNTSSFMPRTVAWTLIIVFFLRKYYLYKFKQIQVS